MAQKPAREKLKMNRRQFLQGLAALPAISALRPFLSVLPFQRRSRTRPGQHGWPDVDEWAHLKQRVRGSLIEVKSPLEEARKSADKGQVDAIFKSLKNPYYISDEAGLTQSTGYVDAWVTRPSAYAIAASNAQDVVAGVNFARKHNLRLVVKGGGHSYHGTSCAPDSLLIWTHRMHKIELHDAFVPKGFEGRVPPQPAVTLEAGCLWMHAYQEVSVNHGRYVQGGGCGTVGVSGLVQSGGFGSFSKNFGTAAAGLLEAEVVVADGSVLTVSARSHPDLFWAIKGGGGGSWGVVTRMTLKTHDLPFTFGGMIGTVKAKSDDAFKRLLAQFFRHYRTHLFNPHWGESVNVGGDNSLELKMVFQGITQPDAQAAWEPFLDWVKASPGDYEMGNVLIVAIPSRSLWSGDFWKGFYPSNVAFDDRPGAPKENVMWAGNIGECGIYWHGYESVWLPESLLNEERFGGFVQALFESSRRWTVGLHFNKGLAGATEAAVEATRDTATNPAVLTAFCLAIIAGGEDPAYAGIAGHEPDLRRGRSHADAIKEAMIELRKVVNNPGSYVSESSYFEKDWHKAYWGEHSGRLRKVKEKYDPEGLFFVHNGVGSEAWTRDGFTRI